MCWLEEFKTGFETGLTGFVVSMGRRKCAIGDSGEIGEGGEGGVGRRAKFKKRAWLSQKPDEVQVVNKLHLLNYIFLICI